MSDEKGRVASILMTGDVYVRRENPGEVFRHIADFFRSGDLVIGNLEGAYTDGGTPYPKGGINVWKATARDMEAVSAGGFHVMTTTNNHIMDFSQDGLLETLDNLEKRGILHVGAGRNRAEACAPGIVERNGTRIAILAYTSVYTPGWEATDDRPGLAVMTARTAYEPPARFIENPGKPPRVRTWMLPESKAELAEQIADAQSRADVVVCAFHWGVSEGHVALTDYQVELGHHAIDCGADLVYGHHPHLLQGIEVYRGRPIFYSLGNLTFARHNASKGHELETMIVKCVVEGGRMKEVGYVPVCGDEKLDPHAVSGAEADRVIGIVEKRSAQFGTRFERRGDEVRVKLG